EFTSSAITSVSDDSNYSYDVTTFDPDGSGSLAITSQNLPDWLTLNDLGLGTAALSGSASGQSGTYDVTLSVSDGIDSTTQSFTIQVTDGTPSPPGIYTDLAIASDSTDGSNWFFSTWFGFFHDGGLGYGWIYHQHHGWIYPVLNTSGGMWFYDLGMVDWIWTHSTIYLYEQKHPLYSHDDLDWAYHQPETANPRLFYHYAFQEWREEGTVAVTVDATEGGEVTGDGIYAKGTEVSLTAMADVGYLFEGWGGDASGESTATTLIADREKSVTAAFRKLTVEDVVDVLFGGGEGLTPDALPDIEVKEIMDSLFH
ncbi:MAG: putative Ig domain-containing protein, partial [Opitutales bacterium]